MKSWNVMIAPELSMEPQRMHRWRIERKTPGRAVVTCLRRFKRHAVRGRLYRVTVVGDGVATTRRVQF